MRVRFTLSYPFIERRLERREAGEPATYELDSQEAIEIRDAERREIFGRIIPFGETINYRGRPESFAPGSLDGIDPSRVRLLAFHDRRQPVGRMLSLEQRDDGAYGVFRIARTRLGDEMLELAADGVISFSPGFIPGTQERSGRITSLRAMPEVSLVAFAAYEGSEILAVREQEPAEPEPELLTREDLATLENRMADHSAAIERLVAAANAPGAARLDPPRPIDWFRGEIEFLGGRGTERREAWISAFEGFQERALEDVTGTFPEAVPSTDASGLIAQEFLAGQLVNVLDVRRPLFASLGSFTMPRSGYARIPVVTQHTEVGPRTGQKDPANSRKLIVKSEPFEAAWVDGAVDVALELILSSELPVLEMVWNDLLGQYAIASEAGVVAEFEAGIAGAVYSGAALPTTSYQAFAEAVATQAMVVFKNTGSPATQLAVTEAQWPDLVSMVDANDRRQFAAIGSSNADASVSLTAQSFTLPGGITVFPVIGLTEAALYNGEALRAADGGPERVEATNVELMGRDLGLLGRTMFVPRIPSGLVVFGTAPI